jgi:hypothetical protein
MIDPYPAVDPEQEVQIGFAAAGAGSLLRPCAARLGGRCAPRPRGDESALR